MLTETSLDTIELLNIRMVLGKSGQHEAVGSVTWFWLLVDINTLYIVHVYKNLPGSLIL